MVENLIYAPWTPEQVELLNQFQNNPHVHPFTCGSGNRKDSSHTDGEGILRATNDGFICPFCNYTQNWAHAWMANPHVVFFPMTKMGSFKKESDE